MADLLAAALDYAAAGIAVFPARITVVEGRKRVQPVWTQDRGGWREQSTTSAEQLRDWFGPGRAWADASLCIDTGKSELVVIDLDVTSGHDGITAWGALMAEHDIEPTPVRVRTPSGGEHWFYREHPRRVVGIDSSGKVGPGIDVRGLGGFVIAWPSEDARGPYVPTTAVLYERFPTSYPASLTHVPVVPALVVERMNRRDAGRGPDRSVNTAPEAPATSVWDEFPREFTRAEAVEFCRPAFAALRSAPVGQINHRLNTAAVTIGHFVPEFWTREHAKRILADALSETAYDGRTWRAESTIASGLGASGWHAREVKTPERPLQRADGASESDDGGIDLRRAVMGGSFILDAPTAPPTIWGSGQRVIWAQGEALMLCGPAGVGKTTVAGQLIAGRLGVVDELFDLPIQAGSKKVLYLAMDRPPQIARALARLFDEGDRRLLDERLLVWKGPPPFDLAKRPDILVELCTQAGADTVIVDSLKDAATKLSDDETGGGYNRARQRALVEGIEVLELHHQRKAGGENKRPAKLDDVYGSTWLTAGAGSVVLLWGEAGDPIVELVHLKQPAEPVGPWTVTHDQVAGRSSIDAQPGTIDLVRNQGRVGMTAKLLAKTRRAVGEPSRNDIERARRELTKLESQGLIKSTPGSQGGRGGGTETVWHIDGGAR